MRADVLHLKSVGARHAVSLQITITTHKKSETDCSASLSKNIEFRLFQEFFQNRFDVGFANF
jgi:hypothetical protein